MGKLVIYYAKDDKTKRSSFNSTLKIKVDNEQKIELEKGNSTIIELQNGKHNVKMFFRAWSENDVCGYVNTDVEINDNASYYIYKAPVVLNNSGKLVKVNSEDEFKKNEKIRTILNIFTFIIILLAIIIISQFV